MAAVAVVTETAKEALKGSESSVGAVCDRAQGVTTAARPILRELAAAEATGSLICAVACSIDNAAVAGNQRCPHQHHRQYHWSISSQKAA